jgi:hypothetical protein
VREGLSKATRIWAPPSEGMAAFPFKTGLLLAPLRPLLAPSLAWMGGLAESTSLSFDIAANTRGSKFSSSWTLEPLVDPNISAIERAFQLARAGKAKDMKGLNSILKREGYMNGQLDNMPSLAKQLRLIMAASQDLPPGKQTSGSE